MTKTLKLFAAVLIACLLQTEIAKYMRLFEIAPDFMILFLVLISEEVGPFGGFCAGSLMSMFYDASVGYVLAINLVIYTFIGYAAPLLRNRMAKMLHRIKHRRALVLAILVFFLTFLREMLYIGYLFLIGAQQGKVTIIRLFIACIYNALLVIPLIGIKALLMHHEKTNTRLQAKGEL